MYCGHVNKFSIISSSSIYFFLKKLANAMSKKPTPASNSLPVNHHTIYATINAGINIKSVPSTAIIAVPIRIKIIKPIIAADNPAINSPTSGRISNIIK